MWLRQITEKLAPPTVKYATAEEFEAEVREIFSNCYFYNSAWEEFPNIARELEGYFNQLWGSGPTSIPRPKPPSVDSVRDLCYSSGKRQLPKVEEPSDGSGTVQDPVPVNPQMNEALESNALKFLKRLQRHQLAADLIKTVPQTMPNYYRVVANPMDLGLIESKLTHHGKNFNTPSKKEEKKRKKNLD